MHNFLEQPHIHSKHYREFYGYLINAYLIIIDSS